MLNDCSKLVVRRNYKIKGRDYGTLNEFLRDRLNLYFILWVNDFTASSRTIRMTIRLCRKFLKLFRNDQSV